MMMQTHYMSRALELANKGLFSTHPNPRVGAVLVKNGKIIGEGWHLQAGQPHAEVHALQSATESTQGAICYVNLEPCSHFGLTAPCADSLISAGISKVYVAMEDPNPKVSGQGIAKLRKAGIDVDVGLMQAEAESLNAGFIKRMTQGRPLTVMKLAMSMDGRTAMESGESQWISSEESRQDVQRLRAKVSAIITGADTVMMDDPRMTVRPQSLGYRQNLCKESVRQPLRIVIDGKERLTTDQQFFTGEGDAMIVLPIRSKSTPLFEDIGVKVLEVDRLNAHLELTKILSQLAKDYQVNELMIEAGATLSGAFLRAGLVDEIQLYMAAKVMGDNARGLFHIPDINTMSQVENMEFIEVRHVGKDLRITCRPLTKVDA